MDIQSFRLVKRLIREHIAPYKRKIAVAVAFMILAAAMTGLFAQLVQPVLDHVLNEDNQKYVLPVSVGVMLCFILRGIGTYVSSVKMIEVGQGIVADLQQRLFDKMLTLDLSYFHAHASGALQSRVMNDINVMRAALAETMMGLGRSLVTVVALIGVMLWQDWRLTIISCFLMPIIVITMINIGKRLRKVSHKTQDTQADIAAHLTQVFQGIRQVKSFVAEDSERARTGVAFKRLRDLNIKSTRLSNLSMPISDLLIGLSIVGLLLYGAWAVGSGELTTGQLISFIAAFVLAYEPVKKLAKMNATFQIGLGASERLFQTIDMIPVITTGPNPQPLPKAPYTIEFKNVSFVYEGAEALSLKEITLKVGPGETVALVGPSGGGKTTMLNMIPRFYDPAEGQLLINGTDLREVNLDDWRRQVALVSQDIVLFNDSVEANIAYGQGTVDFARVEAAAKAANAHNFISDLPQGYQTQLGENGVRLSGGQRQRIALARAILKNAPVLLLDEATSALDTESEILIQRSLNEFKHGRTVVMIAHRLSTIQNADRIVVIKDGQVVEEGSHEVLLVRRGVYFQLHEGNAF